MSCCSKIKEKKRTFRKGPVFAMIDAGDVFNPKDFESITLRIYFKNFTTGTEVRDYRKVSLEEIEDSTRTLIFNLPAKSCNKKHNVTISINQYDKKADRERELLHVTGKVLGIRDVGENNIRAVVESLQYDERSWNDFLALYSNRQDEINNFLKAVKGY